MIMHTGAARTMLINNAQEKEPNRKKKKDKSIQQHAQ
jgi:hypothetical protein